MSEITLGRFCLSNCDGRGDVCERTPDALLRTGQPRTPSDDRGNAALEGRDIRMPEPTEHHRGERVVAGPITNVFSYANTAAYIQSEIAYLQIAGGQEMATSIALPHLLTSARKILAQCQSKQMS